MTVLKTSLFNYFLQTDMPPGGLQSFPLDETCVYYHHGGHNPVLVQQITNCNSQPQNIEASSPRHSSRSHRRMASAPHVPKRTVSRLTSLENNANLNNNSMTKHLHQSSPSRRNNLVAPASTGSSGN
jgi:hypothetical protein